MYEQRRRSEGADDADQGPDRSQTRGASRWTVVIVIAVAIVVLALLVFLHLSGAIGPGIHQGG